ncbi:MAG: hypothetical protein AB8B66_02460 [Rickettsiaceae bacterium]
MKKANAQVLSENSQYVLDFANSIQPRSDSTIIDIGSKVKAVEALIDANDLTYAIELLDEIKDNKLGIIWHKSSNLGNGTKALVRDARRVTTDPKLLKVDAGEKYAMQILNHVRAGMSLLDQASLNPKATQLAQRQLMHIAKNAVGDIDSLDKKVKQYNTQLVHVLEKAGIEEVSEKLTFAKEMANFQDEHKHIVTLTTSQDLEGKNHTVAEAGIMLNGLTDVQKNQWEKIAKTTKAHPLTRLPGMDWYNKMPAYKQDLLRLSAADIATGNKIIPTQMLSELPGIKNAYQKITAIKGDDQSELSTISKVFHCGTPATKIKITDEVEKQDIVDEQVRQLRSFVQPDDTMNLHILNSKTPFNVRNENFIPQQLNKSQKNINNIKISASPINRWRILGGGKNHSEFKNTLKHIGEDLSRNQETKNIGTFLQKGSSIFQNMLEKLTGGRYKSTQTKAAIEINKLSPEMRNDLAEAMRARKLLGSSLILSQGNLNLKISASMHVVENAVKLPNRQLHQRLDESTRKKVSNRIDFCKSGKDRTGYLQTKNTHEAVSSYLGIRADSNLGQRNMLHQVAGGHTQEIAGVQGGSIGCHSVKTNPEIGISSDPQDKKIKKIINQKSSHFNSKVKTTNKNKGQIIEHFKASFKSAELARNAKVQRVAKSRKPSATPSIVSDKEKLQSNSVSR